MLSCSVLFAPLTTCGHCLSHLRLSVCSNGGSSAPCSHSRTLPTLFADMMHAHVLAHCNTGYRYVITEVLPSMWACRTVLGYGSSETLGRVSSTASFYA